jgi:ribosome maturation factor RimP
MGRGAHFSFVGGHGVQSMLRDTLAGLLQPVVEGLGYELWELEYAGGRGNPVLRVYIDTGAEAGITVEDCERVSRAVSDVLDAEDPLPGNYTLEVSSPGIERPLRTARHFAPYQGETVYVEMADAVDARRRFKGRLLAADATTIEVEVDGRTYRLPIAGIRRAHLAPDY